MIHKKKLAFGGLAIAGVLGMTSTAYACVVFKGKLTVATTLTTRADGNQVVGDNGGTSTTAFHGYCAGYAPTTPAAAAVGEQITVTVAGSTQAGDPCTASNNKLDPDVFGGLDNKVFLGQATDAQGKPWNNISGVWTFNDGTGCWASTGSRVTQSDIAVSSTGAGTATFNLSGATYANGTSDASHMCVGPVMGNGKGIIAPLQVVSL